MKVKLNYIKGYFKSGGSDFNSIEWESTQEAFLKQVKNMSFKGVYSIDMQLDEYKIYTVICFAYIDMPDLIKEALTNVVNQYIWKH